MSEIHPDEKIRELVKLVEYWEEKAYTLEVKLEAQAARVPELEAAILQKDEALRDVREALWEENPAAWEHEIDAIDEALSPTPESVRGQAREDKP